MTQHTRSTGEMISTLCYIGVGFWSLGTAVDAPLPKAILLGICAMACFAGALRHQIAQLFKDR